MAKVLVLGSGAREHAIARKLIESSSVCCVYVSPGNDGMAYSGVGAVEYSIYVKSDLNLSNHIEVVEWCRENDIQLVVIGPEDLLAGGLADSLKKSGIQCFGPSASAARIESSKEFSKHFMTKYGIPTARWQSFTNSTEACEYIRSSEFPALVVKASGLAAGKGVIVAQDKEEACQAAIDIIQGKFGDAGKTIVVEELLDGEEVSVLRLCTPYGTIPHIGRSIDAFAPRYLCLAFTDGLSVALMPPAQDHKRLLDNDKGPNTGGMGAYCPCPLIEDLEFVKTNVLQKTVDCLKQEGCPFIGVLYAGLMLTKDGPKVLEFNCRFGDPETQVILPLLKSDLYDILTSCTNEKLSTIAVEFHQSRSAVGVVLASGGYPGHFQKGFLVTGLDAAEQNSVSVYSAGLTKSSDGSGLVTNGGRVMTVVATSSSLASAASTAQAAAKLINFEGKTYRTDIASKAFRRSAETSGLTYRAAGVDIDAGDSLVELIKPLAKSTSRAGCTPDLGLFGGIFDLKPLGFVDPLLVTGTDGVGTKLQVAHAVGNFNGVGIDLVAMSANDVLCHAAEPLFFLDCFSCSKLNVDTARATIASIARGCQLANCALVGGETAEMPGTYQSEHFEVSGFVVGAVERTKYLPRTDEITPGDVVIGIPSSGVHSNGYSLVRAVVNRAQLSYESMSPFEPDKSLGESLLTPTKVYVRSTLGVLKSGMVKAAAHITGGGLPGNIPRVLPAGVGAELDAMKWTIPPVFGWIAKTGNVGVAEMCRTFNCGIGFVIITSQQHQSAVLNELHSSGASDARVIGSIVQADKGTADENLVTVHNLSEALSSSYIPAHHHTNGLSTVGRKKRVAVLISGSGTNLQALVDHSKTHAQQVSFEIALVVSNVADVGGLKRAEAAGIPVQVISHKEFKSREEFDVAVHQKLTEAEIDIVCLAGFMRIVSAGFVQKWRGRMLNIHPSLLPSFKGAHAHRLVLESRVLITGCTVHFVAEDVDAGAIVAQEAVRVYPGDTEETLSERVKLAEHKIFPEALELLASGRVELGSDGKVVWI